MSENIKREYGPPTGDTPGKPKGKTLRKMGSSNKSLFNDNNKAKNPDWMEDELRGLVRFVALHNDGTNCWPTHKQVAFWNDCAKDVAHYSGMSLRTGSACRLKVITYLKRKFKTLDQAEEAYEINYFDKENNGKKDIAFKPPENAGTILNAVVENISRLSSKQRIQLATYVYSFIAENDFNKDLKHFIPFNFIELSLNGMNHLKVNGKDNIIYYLCKSLGTMREDGSSARLNVNKMPFGLLEYNCKFFAVDDSSNLRASKDYMSWMQTMYANFGNSWSSLHLGPMWQYEDPVNESENDEKVKDKDKDKIEKRKENEDETSKNSIIENALAFALEGLSMPESVPLPSPELFQIHTESPSLPSINLSPLPSTQLPSQPSAELNFPVRTDLFSPPSMELLPPMLSAELSPSPSSELLLMPTAELSSSTELSPLLSSELTHLPSTDLSPSSLHPSTLWNSFSQCEKDELAGAETTPKEIEIMHNVQGRPKKNKHWKKKTMSAKVNIAGPSARTIRRHIADSEFECSTEIQVEALKTVKKSNPIGRWFIKADATDMKEGLRESVRGEWTGDCDLGNGKLQEAKRQYDERVKWINGLGLKTRSNCEIVMKDMRELIKQLLQDASFLADGIKKSRNEYNNKKKQKNVAEQMMFALAWTVDGFEKLHETNTRLTNEANTILDTWPNSTVSNLPKKLSELRKDLLTYVKGVTTKKREAASHLLVFMVSDEQRCKKPYAIPVRALPYKNITDAGLRKLREEIRTTMNNIGMVSVGFSTDGEFNSLRTMGCKRPISVIQLIMNAKAKARSMRTCDIENYLKPVKGNDNIRPNAPHPAVPIGDIHFLYELMNNSSSSSEVPFTEAIFILRRKQFPFFYDPYPWTSGKDETVSDCLKSLMAGYLYRYEVMKYTENGVNFKEHLYVPEVDEKTGEQFHEREDHNHVLKRITACTRAGSIPDIDLRAFVACLNSPDTGLTYTALTGQHKQSVPDCERMFSRGVLEFMEKNGYRKEARFVKLVRNWHKASDGRGISEETRSQYNNDMLNFILEDWMPWYWYIKDYSMMDVNRPIKGIQGMTREIVVALIANIESQELRRQEYKTRFLPPEHPRASSTDDLEGFFSILHHLLGPTFDHKAFKDNYRKIEQEFVKRVEPDLEFFYWTGVNERYNTEPLESFNKHKDGKLERLDKIQLSRRADPGVFVANRASIPQKGKLSVRAQFHVNPEVLPPKVLENDSQLELLTGC